MINKPAAHPHAPGSRKARREANAKARAAEAVKVQNQVIALRSSMALDWIVVLRFAKGAHAVQVCKRDAIPEGFNEARSSIRWRGNLPGLRYNVAETVATALDRTLNENRDKSRRIVG